MFELTCTCIKAKQLTYTCNNFLHVARIWNCEERWSGLLSLRAYAIRVWICETFHMNFHVIVHVSACECFVQVFALLLNCVSFSCTISSLWLDRPHSKFCCRPIHSFLNSFPSAPPSVKTVVQIFRNWSFSMARIWFRAVSQIPPRS